MKILVVADDFTVVKTLKPLLSSYHYAVDIAVDGISGLHMVDLFTYDLLLIERWLPRLDGISLCQKLRAQGLRSVILLLVEATGVGGQPAISINAGADDCIVKPFNAKEVVARIQAFSRRRQLQPQPILSWGNLAIDQGLRKANYGDQLLSLRPKEFAILELLLINSQIVLNARAILEQLWNAEESPGEETVRVHIKELRKKFKAAGAPPDFIKTIYRTGYRLNPLYGKSFTDSASGSLTPPQIAELRSVNEELRATVEALQSTQAELSQKNRELELAYRTIEQERQQLQATCADLERWMAKRIPR